MNKPEILSPCGDFERLELAILYGADAVYLGSDAFTMRSAPKNFAGDELAKAVNFAHAHGKRVYLTCNTFPHSAQLQFLPDFLDRAESAGVDALIIADLGVLSVVKRLKPNMEIHISTQAGIINYESARVFQDMGAKRIVLARELSISEIADIRAKTSKDLEIECFVHGAMCMSFSGRCLMSNFMIGRDANQGMCAQPCRWQFEMTDVTRPGVNYPIEFDNGGTYFMNSRDMCMIDHIPELVNAGIDSFKLEGRAKSAYYTAVVTNAYHCALDSYLENPSADFKTPEWIVEETRKVSHRDYSTGFYFSKPNEASNIDPSGGYINPWDVVAVVTGWDSGVLTLEQRNKFSLGDTVELLQPGGNPPEQFKVVELFDEDMQPIETANHATMTVKLKTDVSYPQGTLLRVKKS